RTGLPTIVAEDPRALLGTVARWAYGDPAEGLLLIGITGTNGKTTTAYLVESGLRAAGRITGLIGTVETHAGELVLPSVRTTPEATDLQALFALMRERGVGAAVLEVSSHALALGRVDAVTVDVAVFTNLSQDHLDFHGDLESYFAAKARLFTPEHARLGVIDIDDAHGARLAAMATVPVITVGDRGDWRREELATAPDGASFRIVDRSGSRLTGRTQLLGEFNARNASLALVALIAAGIDPEQAGTGIASLPGVPGRMERIDVGQPFLALVDYAHTPDAVARLLAAVRASIPGRLAVVLGCGGNRDQGKRPLMGAVAARDADLVVFTNDNPRSEDPAAILMAMQAGAGSVPVAHRAELLVEPDRRAAIALAVARTGRGDAVVVAGKGHEQGQEQGTGIAPFDDRRELAAALAGLGSVR
ncbi:MAG TPA: UDP-N-acetylmuramoyl-L-alanyl-D-glutamate--2,6-diaminopimelate ligase, partial [Mycobacteriales bacterium]|nr:UDP-N-acetylmuramoyl-L-alanyl-D-glutamate--2,6-diaminopimelate ligase [Mycobacteriales bacterium]